MLLEPPHLQIGARGAAIDFLFYTTSADGTRSVVPLTDAVEAASFALFKKPGRQADGQPWIVKKAIVIADAAGGRARYVTEDGFLDRFGLWEAQAFVVFGAGSSFIPSEVVPLLVKPNLRTFTPNPTPQPNPVALPVVAPEVSRT